MGESHDAVLLGQDRLSLLDPVDGLALRINHEWVSGRSGNHDTVLDGKLIGWETFQVPLSNGCLIDQELSQLQVARDWNLLDHDVVMEVLVKQLLSEVSIEWSTI
jgi:hypothetical protein